MSTYNWESGRIKLPAGYATELKQELNKTALEEMNKIKSLSTKVWEEVKKVPASKKQETYEKTLENLIYPQNRYHNRWDERKISHNMEWKIRDILEEKIDYNTKKFNIKAPTNAKIKDSIITKKKDNNGKTNTIYNISDGSISITDNTLNYDVYENNHAVENARDDPITVKMFNYLNNNVIWTKGTGGAIVGNDEYNREDSRIGGGGNYINNQFGKEYQTEAERKRIEEKRQLQKDRKKHTQEYQTTKSKTITPALKPTPRKIQPCTIKHRTPASKQKCPKCRAALKR